MGDRVHVKPRTRVSKTPADRPMDSPTTAIIRPGQPRITTTFQFKGFFVPNESESRDSAWLRAVRLSIRWLESKIPAPVPEPGRLGESFHWEEIGQSLRCVSLSDPRIWAARLEQPDSPFRNRPAVAGRTWTTDISLASRQDRIVVGVRVLCASLPFAQETITRTRPRLVLDLAREFTFPRQKRMSGLPWVVTESEVGDLRDYIEDPHRSGPVFLLTVPDSRRLAGLNVRRYLLDENDLAKQVQGLATVVCLGTRANRVWTELVGKSWSAYLGSVRTYKPQLRFDEDSPFSHPLSRAERVLAFSYNGKTAEEAFKDFLRDEAFLFAAERPMLWSPCVFLPEARPLEAALARRTAAEKDDWRALYEVEISALKSQVSEAIQDAERYSDQAILESRHREAAEAESKALRAQLDWMRSQLKRSMGSNVDSAIQIPKEYRELPEWVEKHLAGRLVLHPRAVRGLKGGGYHEPELAFRALLLLAAEYRDMRMGVVDGNEAFDQGRRKLGLRFGGSIDKARAGQQGDEYFIKYPTHSERRRFLEFHLRKGSNKDPRHCLAIYFFWDDDTNQVVVGWLPTHLDNRMT